METKLVLTPRPNLVHLELGYVEKKYKELKYVYSFREINLFYTNYTTYIWQCSAFIINSMFPPNKTI